MTAERDEAARRAELRAPKPQYEAGASALTAFFVSAVIIGLFTVAADLPKQGLTLAAFVTASIAAACTYGYLHFARKRYGKAVGEEYLKVMKERDNAHRT